MCSGFCHVACASHYLQVGSGAPPGDLEKDVCYQGDEVVGGVVERVELEGAEGHPGPGPLVEGAVEDGPWARGADSTRAPVLGRPFARVMGAVFERVRAGGRTLRPEVSSGRGRRWRCRAPGSRGGLLRIRPRNRPVPLFARLVS